MATGMSLRITYWGDSADTMAWMDAPPCGNQTCSGSNAGHAVIRNINLGALDSEPLPTPATEGATVWVIDDLTDELNGQVVPREVLGSSLKATFLADRGIVMWKGRTHIVVRKGPSEIASPGEPGFMTWLAKKYTAGGHLLAGWQSGSGIARLAGLASLGAMGVALAVLLAFAVRRLRRRMQIPVLEASAGCRRSDGDASQDRPSADGRLTRSKSSCLSLLGLMETWEQQQQQQ